jgi:hypothetical protein
MRHAAKLLFTSIRRASRLKSSIITSTSSPRKHTYLTRDYHWEADQAMGPDRLRPLSARSVDLAAAA